MTYIGYITGPKSEPPTGVRVVEPPPGTRQHQRGNLYTVVDVSGDHPDRSAIADRLLSEIQRAYYTAKGSQSQVMVEALQKAQQLLREVNSQSPHYPLQAGLLCTSLLNRRVLMACSGAAFALVRANDRVHMFPSDPMATLGGYGQAPVEVFRQEVRPDDALFLGGGSWLRRVAVRTLASVVMFTNAENCSDAADELFSQGGNVPLPGLLVVVGEDPPPNRGPNRPGTGSGPRPAPPSRRPRFSGLPTALGALPPAQLPPAGLADEGQARPTTPLAADSRPPVEFATKQDRPVWPDDTPVSSFPQEPQDAFGPIFPPAEEEPEQEDAAEGESQWKDFLATGASTGLRQLRGFFSRMLPESHDEPAREDAAPIQTRFVEAPDVGAPDEIAEAYPEMMSGRGARRGVREPPDDLEAGAPTGADEGDSELPVPPVPVLDMTPFAAPQPTRGARARLILLVALAVLILVPAVVAAVTLVPGNNDRIAAERLTVRAEMLLLGAQTALDAGDKVTARERLTEAQDGLTEAIELDGLNDHRNELVATIRSELREVLQIELFYGLTEPIVTFPADARPRQVLVMNDGIYILDSGRQAIIRYRFNPAAGVVSDQFGQTVLREGDFVGATVVGALADMAWLPLIPGVEDRPSLLVTDRNNNVFRYDERIEGASLLEIGGRSGWGSIGQIQTYGQRIYLADDALGAIYRVDPADLEAESANWFSGPTQPDLSGLVTMEIDGDIWLLFEKGVILRYRAGEQVPFSPENSIGLAGDPVDMFVTRQDTANIYLVDGDQDRILVYNKDGAYLSQLHAPEEGLLRGLSGLYIDEVTGTMYLLTQTSLFSHPLMQ